jgi:hypothetical protein
MKRRILFFTITFLYLGFLSSAIGQQKEKGQGGQDKPSQSTDTSDKLLPQTYKGVEVTVIDVERSESISINTKSFCPPIEGLPSYQGTSNKASIQAKGENEFAVVRVSIRILPVSLLSKLAEIQNRNPHKYWLKLL